MILVDTSVMIGYLKGSNGEIYDKFDEIIDKDIPFGINCIYLSGIITGFKG